MLSAKYAAPKDTSPPPRFARHSKAPAALDTYQFYIFRWYNVVDFAIVCITFVIVIFASTGSSDSWIENLSILTVLRFVRVVRLIRLCTERKQIETAAR